MKRLLVLGAFVTASLFFFGSHAGTVQAQPGNYGDAGCGLGSILFGAKPGFVQVFAATTNGTFGSQTFGITTGTSNCGGGGGGTPTARNYVETNREAAAGRLRTSPSWRDARTRLRSGARCRRTSSASSRAPA